ncbi:MAG: hypothetical protein QG596_1618 [Actinomycetota bacterium]|jgi:hypothetical protein|nr:hypothetical protein [Actinomycetota bacterium]
MNSRNLNHPEMINRPAAGSGSETRLADGGFRVALALFTCLFLVWFMFAADFAGAAPYKGKTKGGSSITFALNGSKVTGIRTVVPTLCLETTGGYSSRAGGELYQPVAAGRIGRTMKSKALQPAAMNVGARATKNYEVTLKQRGRVVSGKLKLNFSFLIPDLWTGAKISICSGSTTFTARPV